MTVTRYLLILAAALLCGLSIAKGVKADALDDFYYACPPGGEIRMEYRRSTIPKLSRLYIGCKDPLTLATITYYADLTTAQEAQLRTLGSRSISTARTWSRPASLKIPILYEARTVCDRWFLWADSEGDRAPKMTRAQKLRQACG